ncbi:hypothetical protein Tco_0929895, partial [Tanacetum coccineum]
TLPRNSQKETSFTLTYGSDAIIPTAASLTHEIKETATQEKAKRKENKEREEEETTARTLEQKIGWPFEKELRRCMGICYDFGAGHVASWKVELDGAGHVASCSL